MKTTEELLNKIKESSVIDNFIKEYHQEFHHKSFPEYLKELAKAKQLKVSQIVNKANQGDYVYKIFQGTRKASRDILLAIAIAMQVNLEETQLLLRLAKFHPLDTRDERDAIIIYGIHHQLSLIDVNEILFDLHQNLL